jgi:hypothetical protein
VHDAIEARLPSMSPARLQLLAWLILLLLPLLMLCLLL